jgi:hypothetical protein
MDSTNNYQDRYQEDEIADDQTVEDISKQILSRHMKAFEELAK